MKADGKMMTKQQQPKSAPSLRQFAYWKNLIAATYYLGFFLLLAYLFGGAAGLDISGMIRNGLNEVFILLQFW